MKGSGLINDDAAHPIILFFWERELWPCDTKQAVKPLIQLLYGTRKIPPPPAGPGLPREAPSTFSFTRASRAGNQRIGNLDLV